MSLTSSEMQNTYAVAHDTSKQSGGSVLQAHLSGLQAVASRASHDGYALATRHPTPAPDVSDEALAEIYHKAAREEADRQRDAREWAHSDGKTWHDQMIQCGAAGIRAVREVLAAAIANAARKEDSGQ